MNKILSIVGAEDETKSSSCKASLYITTLPKRVLLGLVSGSVFYHPALLPTYSYMKSSSCNSRRSNFQYTISNGFKICQNWLIEKGWIIKRVG